MKVLHFYKTSIPDSMGGVELMMAQLARATSHLGVSNEVLALSSNPVPPVCARDGYVLHRVKCDVQFASTSFSVSAIARFAELARGADLIHYHFPWPFMDLVHFATRIGKPTVLTYHSDIIRQQMLLQLYKPVMHRFLGAVGRIVATSPNYLSTSDVLNRYRHKVDVIPIGIDKSTYPHVSEEKLTYWRGQLGTRFFLFTGVLRYYKGLHILLQAAQGTSYPIVILGAGPIENKLRAQAKRLGLVNIHFLGYQPDEDKVALLTLCCAVLFPSHLRAEAFGVSLLEGAMFGKPLISSEIGTGTTYINDSDRTGLVVPPSDPLALRNAMDRLWGHPDTAAQMGTRAQARYESHFTAAQMARSYVDLYGELLTGQRAQAPGPRDFL